MTLAGAALLVLLVAAPAGRPVEVHLDGYAEWREGAFLIVDGQRVRMAPDGSLHGRDKARTFADIPLGYEVRGDGVRLPDGTVSARHLTPARTTRRCSRHDPGGRKRSRGRYRRFGQIFDESSGRMKTVEQKLRARRPIACAASSQPCLLRTRRGCAYVVDSKEWNAFAMGNYAIFVYGACRDVTATSWRRARPQLVHATHEHTRRR